MRPPIRVAILDVGQADTIVVHTAGTADEREAILVDCVDQERVFNYLREEGVARVFAVVITHFHADHYRQVMAFYRAYEHWFPGQPLPRLVFRNLPGAPLVRQILRDDPNEINLFLSFSRWLASNEEARVPTATATPDTAIFANAPWDGIIEIFHPAEEHILRLVGGDYNNVSVVLKVTGNASSILLTSDLQPAGWRAMYDRLATDPRGQTVLRADFLKCPHHGAWREINRDAAPFALMLDVVEPTLALISVGMRQPGNYGHPEDHVFDSVAERQIRAVCTEATSKCRRASEASATVPPPAASVSAPDSCAGDVVLDLDQTGSAAMMRPTAVSHAQRVLALFPSHRCNLAVGSAVVQDSFL